MAEPPARKEQDDPASESSGSWMPLCLTAGPLDVSPADLSSDHAPVDNSEEDFQLKPQVRAIFELPTGDILEKTFATLPSYAELWLAVRERMKDAGGLLFQLFLDDTELGNRNTTELLESVIKATVACSVAPAVKLYVACRTTPVPIFKEVEDICKIDQISKASDQPMVPSHPPCASSHAPQPSRSVASSVVDGASAVASSVVVGFSAVLTTAIASRAAVCYLLLQRQKRDMEREIRKELSRAEEKMSQRRKEMEKAGRERLSRMQEEMENKFETELSQQRKAMETAHKEELSKLRTEVEKALKEQLSQNRKEMEKAQNETKRSCTSRL